MKQSYKEKMTEPIWKSYSQLEDDIMSDIVRRIRKTGEITSTADWQINILRIMGHSSEDVENMIKKRLDASYPEMFELYDKVIDQEYTRNKKIYEQVNADFIPYNENEQLQQLTEGFMRQSQEGLSNITRSLGFYLDYGGGKRVFTPLAQVYQGYLDQAVYGIASGAFDYNTVLRRVVKDLTNSGLRSIDYASGYSSRAPVAARRAIMTGISQLTGKISDMNAEKLGTQYFEVAWHSGARPTHKTWQGKVWTKEQLVTVCGLGSVTGLLGANCYHEYYPFFPGLSERNWKDDWLDEQNQKEDVKKLFKGKEYNAYEATQKQRNMETAMRAQRQRVRLMQEGRMDPDEIMLAKARYQGQLDEYGQFCKKMNLAVQRERIYLDGHGRVAPSRINIRNQLSAESGLRTKGGGDYGVDFKVVKSKEYAQRFDKLSNNTKANQLAAKRAKNALVNRNGKNTEELYAISLDSGKDVSKITDQYIPFGVNRTQKFDADVERAEQEGNTILLIHNHPKGLPPSVVDLNELINHKKACGITVGHNGSIYYYSKPSRKIEEINVKVAIRKISEYNGTEEDFIKELSKQFNFTFRKL